MFLLNAYRTFPFDYILNGCFTILNSRGFAFFEFDRSIRKVEDLTYEFYFWNKNEYMQLIANFKKFNFEVLMKSCFSNIPCEASFKHERPSIKELWKFIRNVKRKFYQELNDNLTNADIFIGFKNCRFYHIYKADYGFRLSCDNLD